MFEQFSFIKYSDIELVSDMPSFTNTCFDKREGYVYLWVEKSSSGSSIVYVGKAGKTLDKRCRQHKGGFKNSTTGKKHAERFRKGISLGYRYELHARKSESQSICGEHDIPMECVEELAFIKKFRPPWNSA